MAQWTDPCLEPELLEPNCGRHRRRPSLVDKFSPVRTPVFATSSLSSVSCDFFRRSGPREPALTTGFFSTLASSSSIPRGGGRTCSHLLFGASLANSCWIAIFFPFVRSFSRRTHLIRPDPCLGTCQPSKPFLDRRTFTSSSPCYGGRRRTCSDLLWSLPIPGTLVGFFFIFIPAFRWTACLSPSPCGQVFTRLAMTRTASSLRYLRSDLHRIGPISRSVGFTLDSSSPDFRPRTMLLDTTLSCVMTHDAFNSSAS